MTMNRKLIINELDRHFINPKCELEYTKDYELLLSVMLSAQTTDKSVNAATRELYKKYDTLEKLSTLSENEISSYISRIGFHNVKSKNFKKIVSILKDIGYVPNDREFLESLPGVGRKTASVVLGELFDVPSFAVDTHVFRVAARIGLTHDSKNPLETERQLVAHIPQHILSKAHHWLILHGRYVCMARKPKCEKCGICDFCDFFKKNIFDLTIHKK